MINKNSIFFLYTAASIKRWNEHVRTDGFAELENQAHKMIIAYIIAKCEEDDKGIKPNWHNLVKAEIFEFLHRLVITDIKPCIKHRIMSRYGNEINRWATQTACKKMQGLSEDFKEELMRYHTEHDFMKREKAILDAAGFVSTKWEFDIIYNLNKEIFGIEETRKEVEAELENHYHFSAIQKIHLNGKLKGFIDLVGKLRFQKRWTTCPRVIETSVLGHLMIVAILAYFLSNDETTAVNNFFQGLFHDIPEALTRDIISPVKYSIPGLDEYIKEIEKELIDSKLLPLLPSPWHNEIRYFLYDEFADKKQPDIRTIDHIRINDEYQPDKDCMNGIFPIQGSLVKLCDILAAYYEIQLTKNYSLSPEMEEAEKTFLKEYRDKSIEMYKDLF